MNLQQLKSLAAILEFKSFSAAADMVGLSHSAISLQIKNLEAELEVELFDRSTRPPALTQIGLRTAEAARNALQLVENVRLTASGELQPDSVSIGVVPTMLQDIIPYFLRQAQKQIPPIQMRVKSGMSWDLAEQVLNHELDMAIITAPSMPIPELQIFELAEEPLYAISDKSVTAGTDSEMLLAKPFISFSQKTWLGQLVSARLQSRGIPVDEIMEVESLDAIERLVMEGFGVSVVPQRFLARALPEKLRTLPFCDPQESRRLVLVCLKEQAGAAPFQNILNAVNKLQDIRRTSP